MLPGWLMALLMTLAEAWSARRDGQIRFLRLQVELLRGKLPGNRVILGPDDRVRLLRAGEQIGHRVNDLMGIVSVKTYRQWLREQKSGRKPGRVGRPKIMTASLRALILRLARENVGWGVRRIVGELKKLALTPGRQSVRRVLVDEGILPDPDRHAPKGMPTVWRLFIQSHMNTMVACDFFCKTVWSPLGKRVAYCLAFIHLESRRVFVSPSTYEPNAAWLQQQARNATMWMEDEGIELRFIIHDHDTKFTEAFDQHFRTVGEGIVKTPFQSPIANCFCESWIGSLKRECLNLLMCFSLKHLDHIVQTFVGYHNELRPHQSLGNVPPGARGQSPPDAVVGEIGPVKRHRLLGGLLNHYERKAA